MKAREEVVGFIHDQFRDDENPVKDGKWHYGRVDLRALMDFIYGSEPNCEAEKILKAEFPY